jgi:hypothetical protein
MAEPKKLTGADAASDLPHFDFRARYLAASEPAFSMRRHSAIVPRKPTHATRCPKKSPKTVWTAFSNPRRIELFLQKAPQRKAVTTSCFRSVRG